jgi:DNA-binding NarL/FixJ family response regulator
MGTDRIRPHSTDRAKTLFLLLIDSSDKDRKYYADRLKSSIPNCVVLQAKDGQSGLDLYRSRHVDCLITEFYLPDMSGFELLAEVVSHVRRPTAAVVMLTRTSKPTQADLVKINGAQAFMVKRLSAGDELAPTVLKAIATVRPTHKDRRESDEESRG